MYGFHLTVKVRVKEKEKVVQRPLKAMRILHDEKIYEICK